MKNILTFRIRSEEKEQMDSQSTDPQKLFRTLNRFQLTNKWLSSSRRILRKTILNDLFQSGLTKASLLDVGAGGGDIAIWLYLEAESKGIELEITCLENDPRVADFLREKIKPYTGIRIYEGNFLDLNVSNQYDYVVSNHFLHHISSKDLTSVIQKCESLSKRMFMHNDLYRSKLSYILFWLLTLPISNSREFTRIDGLLSIRRSFIPEELKDFTKDLNQKTEIQIKRAIPGRVFLLGKLT